MAGNTLQVKNILIKQVKFTYSPLKKVFQKQTTKVLKIKEKDKQRL